MIFAAGLGTRMGALTADRPKPLVTVAGRPLIDHGLAVARTAGIGRIVINLHYRAGMIEAHLAGQNDIVFSRESDLRLETGGGLKQALPLLGAGPVMTLNSDAVWAGQNPLAQLRAAWEPRRTDALLLLVPAGRAKGRAGAGDFGLTAEGRLTRGGPFVYSGAQILRTERVAARQERVFSLNLVWDEMALDGRLFGTVYPGGWCDVGHPAAIALAEEMIGKARDVRR